MPLRVLVDYMLKGGVLNSVKLKESRADPFTANSRIYPLIEAGKKKSKYEKTRLSKPF